MMGGKRRAFLTFNFLLALYILTAGQTILSSDGWAMFSTAERLIRHGSIDMNQLLWMGLQQGTIGRDGNLYSRKPPALSLFSAPLIWLGLEIPGINPVRAALFFNAFVVAASCGLFYATCRLLSYGERESLAISLILGISTPLWPYAKTFFAEPLVGLGLLGALFFLLYFKASGKISHAILAGISLAIVLLSKFTFGLFLPLFFWLKFRFDSAPLFRRRLASWVGFLVPQAIAAIFLMVWNWLRYGDPLNTGYLPQESFSAVWWQGVSGLTISPGKGLLWFAPVFMILPAVWPRFHRRHREVSLLIAALSTGTVLLFGKWFMWHGGDCWGPRFLIPLLPLLAIPLAEAFQDRKLRALVWALAIAGFVIQLPGVFVPFGLHREILESKGVPLYAPESFFNPSLSPLVLSWAALKPENFNFIWKTGGKVDLLSLSILTLNCILALWVLLKGDQAATVSLPFAFTFVISAACLALVRADYRDIPEPLVAMFHWLAREEEAGQAIVNPQPEWSSYISGSYRGRLPVYGLVDGHIDPPPETAVWLGKLIDRYDGLWLLQPPFPPERSGIERVLMAFGYRVLDKYFSGLRLTLYLFPKGGMKEREVNAAFGEILLEGYGFTPSPLAGRFLLVELRWRALSVPTGDYMVVLELVDGQNAKFLSRAEMPALWTRPTSSWKPGELIVDRHGFVIPDGRFPACYSLVLQLYDPARGYSLPLGNGARTLNLGEVCLR